MANTENAERQAPMRGVFEDSIAPDGEKWWTLVTSGGKAGIVHLPAELVDADFERRLVQWFEAQDPPAPTLRIVAASARARKSRAKSAPPTLTIARGGES